MGDLVDPSGVATALEVGRIGVDDQGVGGLLAEPVVDTLKRAGAGDRVVATVDRSDLWRAQTPQMFRLGVLHAALRGALEAGFLVTDEASAIEWAGHRPIMVEGHSDNLKVTRPEDLPLAAYFLDRQRQTESV